MVVDGFEAIFRGDVEAAPSSVIPRQRAGIASGGSEPRAITLDSALATALYMLLCTAETAGFVVSLARAGCRCVRRIRKIARRVR